MGIAKRRSVVSFARRPDRSGRPDLDLHPRERVSRTNIAARHRIKSVMSRATATGTRLNPRILRLVGSKLIQPAPGT